MRYFSKSRQTNTETQANALSPISWPPARCSVEALFAGSAPQRHHDSHLIDGFVNKRQGSLPASEQGAEDKKLEAKRLIWKRRLGGVEGGVSEKVLITSMSRDGRATFVKTKGLS